MATAPATVSGLISGLDTSTIISQLMAVERRPITKLQEQINKANAQKRAFTAINTALLSLKTSVDALTLSGTWGSKKVDVSDPDVLSASVTSATAAGTYSFRVMRLAQAGQIASGGFTDADTTPVSPAGGSFDITVGTRTETITVGATATLNDVAAAINAKKMGTSAVVVNTGQGSDPYKLVLTSSQTGVANATVVSNNTTDLWSRWLDSRSYATPNSTPVGGGEFDITAGGATNHIVIAAGDSLQVAASKINSANPNVLAEVVSSSDGTYKLSIASSQGDLAVTNNMSGLWSTATPSVISGTALSSAQNALIEFGTGTPMQVESATNTVTGLAPGLSVNLKSTSAGLVSLTVSGDTAGLVEKAKDFVAKYNAVVQAIGDSTKYDVDNEVAAPLLGNSTLRYLSSDLGRVVGDSVEGVEAATNSLTMVGFKLDLTGKLSLDESTLTAALNDHPDGVTALFSSVADSALASGGATIGTTASGAAGYSADNLINGNADTNNLSPNPNGNGFLSAANDFPHGFTVDFGATRTISQLMLYTTGGAQPGIKDFTLELLGSGGWQTVRSVTGFAGSVYAYNLDQPLAATQMRVTVTDSNDALPADKRTRLIEIAANEERGVAHQFSNLLAPVTRGVDGQIATEQSQIDSRIESLQSAIDALEERMTAKEDRLRAEFTNMEAAMAKMQSQSNMFLAQLGKSSS